MRLLDLYRSHKRDKDADGDVPEEKPEPLPRVSITELWPPSPRVKMLYIGLGFFLFNLLLLCIWAVVFASNTG
jgi:hypothetical protein